MRAETSLVWVAVIASLAAGCNGEVCECETPEGQAVEESVPSNGSCQSLAGEGSPYLFCYARGEAFATAPSALRPVNALTAALDSMPAPGERPVALPDHARRRR